MSLCFGSEGSLLLVLVEGTDGRGSELEPHLLAVYDECLGLQVWLPVALSVAHRVADVVTELLTFTCDVAFV